MILERLVRCLSPIHPYNAAYMTEHDFTLGFLPKSAGVLGAGFSALLYLNSKIDSRDVIVAGLLSAALYLAGVTKDYLSLRKIDEMQADIEQYRKDLRELPPFEYNKKYSL